MMIDEYLTIEESFYSKLKVKDSVFISYIYPVKKKDDVTQILKGLREEHYNAKHICYAYVIGVLESEFHFSDDGEPNGTAGIKILNAIRSKNLTNILVVVVRYFGGTKLGIGPLAKAYYESAKEVLDIAEIKQKFITKKYNLTFSYDEYEKVKSLLNLYIIETFRIAYAENVIISVSVKLSQANEFEEFLKNYFKGKIVYERID